MATSRIGTANSVIGVDRVRPPMTASARGRCSSLPAPSPSARGSRPNNVHSVVIRIGRRRTRAASRIAVSSGTPAARIRSRVKSSRMMPFLTISPTSRMSPMKDETFSAVPVTSSSTSAPTNDPGATTKTTSGSTNDSNCTTITAHTLTTASPSTSSSARKASCWPAYWPPRASRTPGGGGCAASTRRTSPITPPSERPLTSAVITISCCWFSRSRPARDSAGVNEARLPSAVPRRPGQIVDHVRQDRHELDAQARGSGRDLAPHLVDHREDVPGAPTRQDEPRHDVAAVLLRGEEPQLSAGAARRPRDLRRRGENPLGDAHEAVRLVEGRPAGGPIVQHERPLVHLGQEARADQAPQPDPDEHEHRRGHGDPAGMGQHGGEGALVARPQHVERPLHPYQRAAPGGGDLA